MNTAGATLVSVTVTILIMSQLGLANLFPSRGAVLPAPSPPAKAVAFEPPPAAAIAIPPTAPEDRATPPAPPAPAVAQMPTEPVATPTPQPRDVVIAQDPIAIPAAAVAPAPSAVLPFRLKPEAKLLPVAAGTMLSGVRRVMAVSVSPAFAKHIAARPAKTPARGAATASPGTPLIPPADKRSAVGSPPAVKQPLSLHTDLIVPGAAGGQPVAGSDPKRQAALR